MNTYNKEGNVIKGVLAPEGSYSWALIVVQQGKRIARQGWNGKGMFLYHTEGSIIPVSNLKPATAKALYGDRLVDCEETVTIAPHLDMWTAQGNIAVGWKPSNLDQFANDWYVVE